MQNTHVLTSIKDAEHKAEQLLQNANKTKADNIEEARKKALELISQAGTTLEKENESHLAAFEKELNKKKAKIVEKGQADADELQKQAKKNVDKAAQFLIAEFEKMI